MSLCISIKSRVIDYDMKLIVSAFPQTSTWRRRPVVLSLIVRIAYFSRISQDLGAGVKATEDLVVP